MIAFNAIHAEITWTLSADGTLIISGTGDMEDSPWSYQRDKIKKVTIKNGVTSIGVYAFAECYYLTSITIPNSVTSIGDDAFSHCYNLTSITIPNSVTSIGKCVFSGCSKITSITIPNSVTSIGMFTFQNCGNLNNITFSNSLTSVGMSAFDGTQWYYDQPDGLVYIGPLLYKYKGVMPENTNINIKEGTKSIADYAFIGYKGLTSVTIPNSVENIGEGAFCGCSGLTSIIIPNSVASIGDNTFDGCSGLYSVTIPESVTNFGRSAFGDCSGLTSITIPNSVTSIGDYAFEACSGLTSITIPESVTSIGVGTFSGCSDLKKITVEQGNEKYDCRNNCNAIIETESNTLIAGCKNSVIPNSVTSIGDAAFSGCSGINSVTIPNSVNSIGYSAFAECSNLTSVTIPNSVTSIGGFAFEGTKWYENQPDGLVYIGQHLYKYKGTMPRNTNILVKAGTKEIVSFAFRDCSGLTSVTIPESVTSIGSSAFRDCLGLTSITIPNSVTSIGDWAFGGCTGLTSITNISTTPQNITYDTFFGYGTLHVLPGCKAKYAAADVWKNFTIVEDATSSFTWELSNDGTLTISGTSMPDYSTTRPWVSHQTETKIIIIANGMTNIGSYAFFDYMNLTSITIPETITSIGDYTFSGCSNLTSVTNLSTIPQKISANTFTTYGTLHVLPGCKAKYATADFWKNFEIVEDATTGIDIVEGTPTISADKIFSISGQLLDKTKKGVNIINGKKILVK